jgi:acyl dehydratase
MASYLEDFELGESVLTAPRSVTKDDVMAFVELSGDDNPMHTDAEFAQNTPIGQCVAHGLLVLSMATGLSARTGHLTGTALAFLGVENWRFNAPVFFGDSIRLRWTVLEKRLTSDGGAGVLKRRMEILNQHDKIVQSGVFVTLVKTRGA